MNTESKLQFVTTFTALITAAFGLVAAMAWNTAIQTAVSKVLGTDNELWGQLVYAILVTLLAVIMVIFMTRTAKKLNDQIKEEEKK